MHEHINLIFPETKLMRPKSLNNGGLYLYWARDVGGIRSHASVVKFQNYDACPAFVIIKKSDGSRTRCLREDLFRLGDRDQINTFQQFSPRIRAKSEKLRSI
jgi:hypothetical protein